MPAAVLEKPQTPTAFADRLYIAMRVADEVYGLDIAVVHTVITPQAVTHVPKAPPFVKGVINLRGRILPVIDLRARFGLPPRASEQERHARIVVIETDGLSAGLIVDGVSEVLRLSPDAIDPPSHLVSATGTECIVGIGRIPASPSAPDAEERLMILLDVFKTVAPRISDITD
ncbi:MAG: chemotaxis protein CheW [Armatimonadota bacterium]|nr:chemotaxis protein CheW [Armatimonadota bacterium]